MEDSSEESGVQELVSRIVCLAAAHVWCESSATEELFLPFDGTFVPLLPEDLWQVPDEGCVVVDPWGLAVQSGSSSRRGGQPDGFNPWNFSMGLRHNL